MKVTNTLPRISLVATMIASALALGASASTKDVHNQNLERVNTNDRTIFIDQTGRDVRGQFRDRNQLTREMPNYYIIELKGAPVALYDGELPGFAPTRSFAERGENFNLNAPEVTTYQDYLLQQQQQFASNLQARFPQAQVTRNLTSTINAVIVEATGPDIIRDLRKMPGVVRVHEHQIYHTQMDASNPLINAPEVWEMVGSRAAAGAGVRVAVIDNGIRPENPMFQVNGHAPVPSDQLPGDDFCAENEGFCNDKLIVARWYQPTFQIHPEETLDPLDYNGHGTHVSGTAVGNEVTITYNGVELNFSGVAPGAYLMTYKALFATPTGGGSGSNVMLVGALEDAFNDGADIVNNSWGGGAGGLPGSSPYRTQFQAMEAAGVLIATAAGNSGPGPRTIGCPACIESGLAVANSQHGREFANEVDAAGITGIEAVIGSGPFIINDDIVAPLMPTMVVDEANALACDPFEAGSFTGHIALVQRGICAFEVKANNLQDAGAVGMILYNNTTGFIAPSMGAATLPTVSILQADGEAILDAFEIGDQARISATFTRINQQFVDAISNSSSRGPNGDSTFLKPDIAAPGTAILSAYAPRVGPFNAISGTSMASPHVAGAAALVRSLRPELDAHELKSVLMTSTTSAVRRQDGVTQATPFDMGAGRLDIAAAMNTAVAFDTASIANNACVVTCTFERTVSDLVGEDTEWTPSFSFPGNSSVFGEVSVDVLEVEADGETTFTITLNTANASEGWQFGEIVWTDRSGNYADARMPIAVFAQLSDNEAIAANALLTETVTVGEPARFRARVADPAMDGSFNGEIKMSITNPSNTAIQEDGLEDHVGTVLPDSVVVTAVRAEGEFSVTGNGSSLEWVGEFDSELPSAGFAGAAAAGVNLRGLIGPIYANEAAIPRIPCSAGEGEVCDEVIASLDVSGRGGLNYFGVNYSTINISENGFVTLGQQDHSTGFINMPFPNENAPNNVVAPYWSDYVFGGDVGGNIYVENSLASGGFPILIIQWDEVVLYDDYVDALESDTDLSTLDRHTFTMWWWYDGNVGGTDDFAFRYLPSVNSPNFPENLSIGFENATGEVGATFHFNGQGNTPQSPATLFGVVTPGEQASLAVEYDLLVTSFGSASNTTASVNRTQEVMIDLSSHVDASAIAATSLLRVEHNGTAYNSVVPFTVEPVGDVELVITQEPSSGSLMLMDDYVVAYQAADDFSGSVTFSYVLEDEAGNRSPEGTATVTVNDVPPTAIASAIATPVRAGDIVQLNGSGSSPIGLPLTYSWSQVSGPSVSISSGSAANANFAAPPVSEETKLTFRLTVSDGNRSASTLVDVDVRPSSSRPWYRGSFGGLIVLFGLPLLWMRRRAAKQ